MEKKLIFAKEQVFSDVHLQICLAKRCKSKPRRTRSPSFKKKKKIDSPPASLFKAGDLVQGYIAVNVNSTLRNSRQIDITLLGKSQSAWYDKNDQLRFSNSKVLYHKQTTLYTADFLSSEDSPYRFPFNFKLSSSLPTSVELQPADQSEIISISSSNRGFQNMVLMDNSNLIS